ncbi:MAG: hypothetical protein VKJ24_05870, partial [Synechococcales bacterium]|nr:hypothetical protein [Synechococcales bacterium]
MTGSPLFLKTLSEITGVSGVKTGSVMLPRQNFQNKTPKANGANNSLPTLPNQCCNECCNEMPTPNPSIALDGVDGGAC